MSFLPRGDTENLVVLGLDLGTHCGYALGAVGDARPVASGVWHLKTDRWQGGGMRFLRLRRELDQLRRAMPGGNPLGAVYYEQVRAHKGVDAAHVYGGLLATVQTWCEEHEIAYGPVTVAAIKQAATGKGTARKEAVEDACRARFGIVPSTDDEADAAWCWFCGCRKLREG